MIMGQNVIQVFKGSFVMVILLVASIAALALIVERLWYFSRNRFNPSRGLAELRRLLKSGGLPEALNWVGTQRNPMGRLISTALENLSLTGDELSDLLYSQVLDERVRFERLLGGMGTLANAATLLGLLGTVTGLIGAFHNIAVTGSGGPAVVSAGIAEALITTAFGLMIGIPTLFFYNYFSKKSSDNTLTLESSSDRLIVMLERYKLHVGPEIPRVPPPAAEVAAPRPQPAPPKDAAWEF